MLRKECSLVGIPAPEEGLRELLSSNGVLAPAGADGRTDFVCGDPVIVDHDLYAHKAAPPNMITFIAITCQCSEPPPLGSIA